MARDGSVGAADYAAVTEAVNAGASRQEAFKMVADAKGGKAGTVAANYYRVARAQGGSKPRATRTKQPSAVTPSPAAEIRQRSNGKVGDQLAALIQQMVDEAVDERLRKLLA